MLLTLIKELDIKNKSGGKSGLFRCICGNEKVLRINSVNSGHTKSCGCLRKQTSITNGRRATTHGKSRTRLYTMWHTIVKRSCTWKSFEEFCAWAEPIWKPGYIIYDDKSSTYNPDTSRFVLSKLTRSERIKATSVKKYGCDFPSQSSTVKDKIRKTNLERYGVEYASQSESVKQNAIKNNLAKYGVDYPQQLLKSRWRYKEGIVESPIELNTEVLAIRQEHIEDIIGKVLESLGVKYECGVEPDFLLPDYNIVIEADNLYRHCELNAHNRYNYRKMKTYNHKGLRGLFFRENEVLQKTPVISSIILNATKQNNVSIYARKCSIVELNPDDRNAFFQTNHLMGKGWHNGKCIGLEYNGDVVSGLEYTFIDGIVDIARFCNILNTSVVGGFSRILSHIVKVVNPSKITTFIDKRYGVGDYLYNLGFDKYREQPSYVWIKNYKVLNRLRFKKSEGYERGYYKLYDCGQARFIKK